MRVATWNLERRGSRAARLAQQETLRELAASVVVLTEPPASYVAGPGVVTSPPLRSGKSGMESWLAIVGAAVEPYPLDVPFEHLAVVARLVTGDRPLIVYGTVLPWLAIRNHAPELVREGETFIDVFERVLAAQRADLLKPRQDHEQVVWAGDFNQSLAGANAGGSAAGRAALNRCLDDLGFIAWNANAEHARPGLRAIDLVCGPTALPVTEQGRIDPARDGVTMTDHAGYWVDFTI